MTFTILFFNTINYTFWITRFSTNLCFVIQNKKKEPVTETNPQQALGLMKLYNVLSS